MIIKKWLLKAVVQKSISIFPNRDRINYLFQKYVTRKGVYLNDIDFGYKLEHIKDHITHFEQYGEVGPEKTILELGTGWFPIIPLFMYLTNSGKVISFDIYSWMTKKNQILAINKIREWKTSGQLSKYFKHIDKEKWAQLEEIVAHQDQYSKECINKIIGLKLYVRDMSNSGLAAASVDYICSNNTFEHIYFNQLEKILLEFKRILKPNGVMSHGIELSDHFSNLDQTITRYNFLKFINTQWKLIDNNIQPQNRKRFKDYLSLYEKIGIPAKAGRILEGNLSELALVTPHREFDGYTKAELAVLHGYIISSFANY